MDRERIYRRRWWTLLTLSLSLVIIGLDNTVLNVALPTLQLEFDASASTLQWMIDSYILVFAGLLLTMGALGDRFGRAQALNSGLLIFGGASLAAAYAQSSGQLIAGRAVMGIGGALIMPATLSIIIDVFPREERGRAVALWAGAAGIGVGLGPLFGGLLLEYFWWGSVFMVNVPVVVTALVLGWFFVPDSRDPHPMPIDLPGALLSVIGVTALVYAIIEAPAKGWLAPVVVTGFLAAVVLLTGFVVWERRTSHPMLDLRLFQNPRFAFGSLSIGIASFALFGIILATTQYLQFVHGYTPLEAGVRLIPIAFGIMVGAGNSHRMVERFRTKRVVTIGLVLLALVMASLSLWTVDTDSWMLGLSFFFLAMAMGTILAPSTDAVMGAVPEHKAGVGSAMNDVTRQVFGAFGVAVMGSILNAAYTDKMEPAVTQLPPEAAAPAKDSVGAAVAIAERLAGPAGDALAAAAKVAFVDAMAITALAAAATALVGAILAARYLPAEHLPVIEDAREESLVDGSNDEAALGPAA
jgi:EmrB/QacA subfamily drug resistance transporter